MSPVLGDLYAHPEPDAVPARGLRAIDRRVLAAGGVVLAAVVLGGPFAAAGAALGLAAVRFAPPVVARLVPGAGVALLVAAGVLAVVDPGRSPGLPSTVSDWLAALAVGLLVNSVVASRTTGSWGTMTRVDDGGKA
jgi:hypothetical protein